MKSLDTRFALGALFVFFMSVFGWAQEPLPMEPGTGTAEPGTGDVRSSSSMGNPVFPGSSSGSMETTGKCTSLNTVTIASLAQLYEFAETVNNAIDGIFCGELADDIVMDGRTEWTPINVQSSVKVVSVLGSNVYIQNFATVVFNGNGHTISGLKFNDENRDSVGFFGRVEGVLAISNLGIVNSDFKGRNYVGGLVGYNGGNNANLTIENSYNAGTVSGGYVGGLVGYNGGTLTITNSYNADTVSGGYVGGLVGYNSSTLTITNSFFLATGKDGDKLGGTPKSIDDFRNGDVAAELHNWCEKEEGSETCKEGGLNGSAWGQALQNAGSLPDLSGVIGTQHSLTLHTFEGDTRVYPTKYAEEYEFILPTDLVREGYTFLGWSTKWVAESVADMVTSVAKGSTGAKEFYAQWKEFNDDGCFEIASTVELYAFAGYVNNATDGSQVCGKLTKDIVVNTGVLDNDGALNGTSFTPWTPMNVKSSVQVTLDGNGKTISGLYFNNENENEVGLFGGVNGTVSISDLGVKDSYFKGRGYVGGLVGENYDSGILTITNSYNAGTVSGRSDVGGLVGRNVSNVGGSLTITNSYNSGAVSGIEWYVGGLVGENYDSGILTITNSYNAGTVSGTDSYVGGLVGRNVSNVGGSLTITNSYNSGAVSGTGGYVGGLVGYNSGTLAIENSYNAGTVSGALYVGGLVGYGSTLIIENSYNVGTVSGTDSYVGGLVGFGSNLTITNSYNAGTVSGRSDVGGLVGCNVRNVGGSLTITNSYNAGTVSGRSDVGGLVGSSAGGSLTITNSFFLETGKDGDELGGESRTLDDFHDGKVAKELHDWCEKKVGSETCKVGGKYGSVWGQDLTNANSLPDLSGVVGHKYGSVVFFDKKVDGTFGSAEVDATSEFAVSFTKNIVVSGPVKFKRTFAGSGYSTIMLPFQPNCSEGDCIKNGENVKFYEFGSYANATVRVTEVSPSALQANTPYLVQAAGVNELVFKNGGTFNTMTGGVYNSETGDYKKVLDDGEGNVNGWTIYGTYAYKQWNAGDAGTGSTYGFVGAGGNVATEVGKFKKAGAGAYIFPMRAYLKYVDPNGNGGRSFAPRIANNISGVNGLNSASGAVASLPETINVVIDVAGDASDDRTVIGAINTRTGEFKFADDRWFDLNGRYLGNKKPTQKGAYYNNGKKVIVK